MTGFYWTVAIYQHQQTPRETTCTNGKMCLLKLYIHYINSILIIKSKSVIVETKKLLVVFCRNQKWNSTVLEAGDLSYTFISLSVFEAH